MLVEDTLSGLVELNDYTSKRLISLDLNLGCVIFVSTPFALNVLTELNYSFINTFVKLDIGGLLNVLIVPKSFARDNFVDIVRNLSMIPDEAILYPNKDTIDIKSALDILSEQLNIKINKIYFNEPAHTISGSRILFNRRYIPIFGSHYYSNSTLE